MSRVESIVVQEDFIDYRTDKTKVYDKGDRDHQTFLNHIDCEIMEWNKIDSNQWYHHPSWMVDAITPEGLNIDCKFITNDWKFPASTLINMIKQRFIVDYYYLYRWVDKPDHPLRTHQLVKCQYLGRITSRCALNNVEESTKYKGRFIIPYRKFV